jgi:hypothetical protein
MSRDARHRGFTASVRDVRTGDSMSIGYYFYLGYQCLQRSCAFGGSVPSGDGPLRGNDDYGGTVPGCGQCLQVLVVSIGGLGETIKYLLGA